MSKKIFYTDTSVPPTRLVESGSVGGTGGLPQIAALDPLMAASNFEPDPAFAPSEEDIQNRINQLNAELDQSLAALDRRIQGYEARLEDSGGRDREAIRLLAQFRQQRESDRLVYQDRINNVRQQLSSNNFSWLRNRGFRASTANIQALAGSVKVFFGSVNEHLDQDNSFSADIEKNLSYRRRSLGGVDGYTKQSIVVQGLLPEYRSARIATLSNNRFVSDAEFQLYGARVQREIGSFKKFVNILNRTAITDNAEKERLGLRAENPQLGNQYMNPYTCVFMPIALQTDWVKDSKVTHDYLNKLKAVAGVTTIDAEFNYPAPVKYYNMSPDDFAQNGADGNYSALLNQQTVRGARVRTEDTYDAIPESRKRQLPRYVQVSFNRRSFGRLSKKIEEVNGFSTFVPKLIDAIDGETKRDYFFKSRFQFLDGDGRVVEADQTVPVQVVDMEAELNDFIASLTSQEEPTALPPDYFGEKPVVKDEAGNDSPPQLDECVSFLDRIKMASLQSELRAFRQEKIGNLNYENLFKYIQDLNDDDDQTNTNLNAGKPEVLFYRIDQHEVDAESGDVNLEPKSKYYVRGGNTKYTYVDPRVEFGAKYKYVIYAYVIAPALHYDIGQVRPVVQGGDVKSPPMNIGRYGMEGAFTTAQDPFSEPYDYRNNNDTLKQAYDAAKQNVADFRAALSEEDVRRTGATLNEMNVAMNVYSRGRLLLAKVPVSSIIYESGGKRGVSLPTTTILDRPPVPPHVDIVPFRNNSRQILINFNGQTDKIFPSKDIDVNDQDNSIPYIGIEPSDNNVFETIREAQLLENFDLPEGHLEFASEGEDLERFEVYRTTFEPDPRSPYEFFAGNKLRDVYKILGQSYTDNIRPNVNYYYTFRAVDKQGNFSNPTEIYKVYISEDKGQVVPTIKAFKPVRPRNQKDNKTMRKFLMIDPYFLQTTPAASQGRIGQLPEKTLGSKFKIRITSRDTGRKVDLNLRFEPAKVIRTADLLDIAVRLKNDLLNLSPGLVEDRITEINNQLQSANVSVQDFEADLEAKLREQFGEGNYESFLAQFQGRSQEE
jgi:hypothetical protein